MFLIKLLPLYGFTLFLLFWPAIYRQIFIPKIIAANQQYITQHRPITIDLPLIEGKPVRLEIPRLKVDVTVTDGYYYPQARVWTLSEDKVHHAVSTSLINNKQGHTLLYGHATQKVLEPTDKLVSGDQMIITVDSGKRFEYYFSAAIDVIPTNTDILNKQTLEPEVTLLTCDGTFYQYRRLMTFRLLRVI